MYALQRVGDAADDAGANDFSLAPPARTIVGARSRGGVGEGAFIANAN